jgi:hypothetical protein
MTLVQPQELSVQRLVLPVPQQTVLVVPQWMFLVKQQRALVPQRMLLVSHGPNRLQPHVGQNPATVDMLLEPLWKQQRQMPQYQHAFCLLVHAKLLDCLCLQRWRQDRSWWILS